MTLPIDIKDLEERKFIEVGSKVAVRISDAVSNSLVPGVYDYIALSNYSGSNPQTIVFKTGGSAGTTVATLTLTYDGSGNLLTVTKS